MKTTKENVMADNPKQTTKGRSMSFYVFLGAALLAFIQSFTLLSPILLIFLISLSINPVISRMRFLIGSRRVVAGLVTAGFVAIIVLTGWAFAGPMKESVINLTEQ